MKILVTGGSGYLGGAIVRAAHARGHEVVVFARTASSSGLPGTLVDGDIRDAELLAAAARSCAAICHMAALVTIWRRRRAEFDEVNIGGLQNVLKVAALAHIDRVVYTSSFLALPPSDGAAAHGWNDYQRTKLEADRLAGSAVQDGLPLIRVYPGVVYGPGKLTEGNLVGRLLTDHLAGRLPGIIGADKIWSFAFIDDVAASQVTAIERGEPGASYQLGGENAPQMRLFELVRDRTGRALPRRIPIGVARAIAVVEEGRARMFGATPMLTRGTLGILTHDWAVASAAAERALGHRITPLAAGLDRTLADLEAQ